MGGFVSSVGNAISTAVSDVGSVLSNPTVDALGLGALDVATGGLAAPLDATALMSDAALGGSFAGDAFSLGTAAADAGTAASAITPAMLAAAQASSDPIGMLSYLSTATPSEVAAATSGGAGSALSLADVLGTAKTGSQLIGGLGQLAGATKLLGGTGVKAQQAAPFAPYQAGLASQLNNLIQNPSTITSTPGYQFNLQQYMQALQAQQAAQGKLASGGALVQAGQMGQQYAQSSLANQEQLLASLTGATQSPASAATAGSNIGATNIGSTLGGISALSGGVSNVLNPLATLYSQYNTSSPSVS
jgi:hypothetical protein